MGHNGQIKCRMGHNFADASLCLSSHFSLFVLFALFTLFILFAQISMFALFAFFFSPKSSSIDQKIRLLSGRPCRVLTRLLNCSDLSRHRSSMFRAARCIRNPPTRSYLSVRPLSSASQTRRYSSIDASQLRFGQPLHETHPHLLKAGERQ